MDFGQDTNKFWIKDASFVDWKTTGGHTVRCNIVFCLIELSVISLLGQYKIGCNL